jgi:hypothetical protein
MFKHAIWGFVQTNTKKYFIPSGMNLLIHGTAVKIRTKEISSQLGFALTINSFGFYYNVF